MDYLWIEIWIELFYEVEAPSMIAGELKESSGISRMRKQMVQHHGHEARLYIFELEGMHAIVAQVLS